MNEKGQLSRKLEAKNFKLAMEFIQLVILWLS
jgi:hypothetical protein